MPLPLLRLKATIDALNRGLPRTSGTLTDFSSCSVSVERLARHLHPRPDRAAGGFGAALAPRPPGPSAAPPKVEPRDKARAVTKAGVWCTRWLGGFFCWRFSVG